eukprot:COSAG01_NODE_1430_length_10325_cov_7.452376_10_plen_42_part_00
MRVLLNSYGYHEVVDSTICYGRLHTYFKDQLFSVSHLLIYL